MAVSRQCLPGLIVVLPVLLITWESGRFPTDSFSPTAYCLLAEAGVDQSHVCVLVRACPHTHTRPHTHTTDVQRQTVIGIPETEKRTYQ